MYNALESRLKEMGLQIDPLKATNRQQMIDNLKAGIEDNKTYLALTSPTTAQNTAQIKKLTRQNNRLIRLVTNLLETAE
jgi:hypothetical protein